MTVHLLASAAVLERVLVVTAHPDDVDFGAAGTIATWTAAGVEVSYCVATFGDSGGYDDTPRREMSALREQEQRAAAAMVGVTDVTFLGYPDGRVHVDLNLRRDLTRQIRRVRPQRVLTHSPERNWKLFTVAHPDHLAVGEATLCAVYPDARNPHAHPELLDDEGLASWTVDEVWLTAARAPDHVVDVTDSFARKVAAVRAHASQTSHLDSLEESLRERLSRNASDGGLPGGRLAEAFQVVHTA